MSSYPDAYGRSELHYAALDGSLDAVRWLVEGGMDVSAPDNNAWTPLHFASQSGQLAVARYLISAGAQVEALDAHGNTPLIRATFESQGNGEMISLLRDAGADPLRKNKHGVTAVALARSIGNYNVAQYFADLD